MRPGTPLLLDLLVKRNQTSWARDDSGTPVSPGTHWIPSMRSISRIESTNLSASGPSSDRWPCPSRAALPLERRPNVVVEHGAGKGSHRNRTAADNQRPSRKSGIHADIPARPRRHDGVQLVKAPEPHLVNLPDEPLTSSGQSTRSKSAPGFRGARPRYRTRARSVMPTRCLPGARSE